ncbi:MAG: replicative DNA helicase [Candidatus Marinimicrobia bacterium]|jgi:replicative DNA helicase|nr:replicative DNA helicase [Candidatus Neomarinimicrobiota bacterium]MDP6456110.1 replicative DNA helicase [Candidatus Neomarinimicrobiota bacterium]MDP6592894.1 replicative DNA helicase [Candidatus Neomarinimicrobiota bacterium]MDP6836167.1 replicative DNA helicase [Candidatus Neomarinimicrobiota bacterium]MDP6965661.1 replicative DNA helicase [Candidatus Neomarinimicrobiota bacterium]
MARETSELELHVPPQAIEAEQAVLGAMLSSKEAVSRAMEILAPESFYKDAHAKIFKCMLNLFNSGDPVDAISVVDNLKKGKDLEAVGGAYYITGLSESVPTTANIDHYARIVLEKASLRGLIDAAAELSQRAYNDRENIEELLDTAEQKIFAISQNRLRGGFEQLNPVLQQAFEELDRIHQKPGSVTGVPSGLMDLDELTSGFQDSELIVVAGRPGMGKTSLAMTIGRNAAVDHGIPVGIFSLEMSNNQLALRLLCAEARVDSHLVRTGKLPKQQWKNLSLSVGTLAEAPIYLDDTPAIGITEIRAKSRRLKAEKDVKLIIIDYLQLMRGPYGSESRQQEISTISRSLKSLAKEIEVPVIALSQLSRAPESRSDHRPQLSDLRESGAIEQDADVVMFLYRQWMYTRDEEDRRKAQILLAKQRNGPTGTVETIFVDRYAKFESATIFEEEGTEVPF